MATKKVILTTYICAAIIIAVAMAAGIISYIRNHNISMGTTNNLNKENSHLPRGYRNNNPLNIRVGKSQWKGKVTPNTDGVFEQFENMGYGFRAALKLIRNYISGGNNTIRKIVSRWAPATENNTSSYIANVSKRTGINPDTIIDRTNKEQMTKIVYAMAISENGSAPLWSDIYAGWDLL